MTKLRMEEAAHSILARNDRGGYTVPTDRLTRFSGTGSPPSWPWDLPRSTWTVPIVSSSD